MDNRNQTEEGKRFEEAYEEWKKRWDHHWQQVSHLGGGGGIDESTEDLIASEPEGPPGYPPPMRKNPESAYYKGSRCFIATVVYGNPNASEVQVLRDFRDNVLMETGLGRKAVDLYYNGFGEKVANLIERHIPSAIPVIKKGLDYLVQRYQVHK